MRYALFLIFIFVTFPLSAQEHEPMSIVPLEIAPIFDGLRDKTPVITSIDVDPSGKFLAIGGDNHRVRVWNIETKQNQRAINENLRDQIDWIRGIAFSDDQKHLVVVAQDGKMEVHNLQTGAAARQIQGKHRGIQSVAFRPGDSRSGGREFAVCGFYNSVSVYNVSTGALVRTLRADGTNNRAIRFSPNGALLAVAGASGVVRVWNAESGEVLFELPGDGRRINALAFNSDGTQLAVGGDGPNITVWNTLNGRRLAVLPERPGKTYSLEFCGHKILASGESDNVIRFWNLETQSYYANTAGPEGHTGTIATLVYDPQKSILASGSFDTTVRFWTIP